MSTTRVVLAALVFSLAGMVLVYLGVGYLLVDKWHVESDRVIDAPAPRVAALLVDLSTWGQWSSMDANLGPQTRRSVFGEPGIVGHGLKWSGSQGVATLTLRAVTPDKIAYEFHGEGPDRQPLQWHSSGSVEWHEVAGKCHLHWHDEGHWDSIAGRWFGWFGVLQQRAQEIQSTSFEGLADTLAGDPK